MLGRILEKKVVKTGSSAWCKVFFLIVVPWVFVALIAPFYNVAAPMLGGWPFLYWYLSAWIFVQSLLTFIVYQFIDKEGW